MGKSRRLKFKGIKANTAFCKAAQVIINVRCKSLNKAIKKFLKNNTVENLHEIRIAVRRLRYNMEIFGTCFEKKNFLIFYNTVEHLQDLTGRKRDLDVLLETIQKFSANEGIKANEIMIRSIEKEKDMLNNTLKLDLFNYLQSRELKDFLKLLN